MNKRKSIKKHFNLLKEFRSTFPTIKSDADSNSATIFSFIEGIENALKFNNFNLTIKEIDQDNNFVCNHNIELNYYQILLYSFFLDASNISALSLRSLSNILSEGKTYKKNSLKLVFENQEEENLVKEVEEIPSHISDFFEKYYNIDKVSKKSEIVSKLLESNSLNEFKAYLFYFLYKKFYDNSIKLTIDPTADIKDTLSSIILNFKSKLENKQSLLTVNFGAYFEEVFRKAVFEELGISKEFELDVSHASKKSAIALIYCCNNRYNKKESSVFSSLLSNRQPDVSDYEKDFENIRFAKGKGLVYLSRCVKQIISDIKNILDLDQDLYFNDLEKDDIFKKIAGKNSPFDFIARDKNIATTTSHIGLLDLKINNKNSEGSSPISKGATGSNGGTQNSALQMIKKFIKKLNIINNNNIGISFFSLMQIKYSLDFNVKNNYDILIENFEYKISRAKESIEYSMDKREFILSDSSTQKQHNYHQIIEDSVLISDEKKIDSKLVSDSDESENINTLTIINEKAKKSLLDGIQSSSPEFNIIKKNKANKSLENIIKAYNDIKFKGGIEELIKNANFKLFQNLLSGEGASILKLIHEEPNLFREFVNQDEDRKKIIGGQLDEIINDSLSNPAVLVSILIDIITDNSIRQESQEISDSAKKVLDDTPINKIKSKQISLLGAITSVYDEANSALRQAEFYKKILPNNQLPKITADTRFTKKIYKDVTAEEFKRVIIDKIESDYLSYFDKFIKFRYPNFKDAVGFVKSATVSEPYLPKFPDLTQTIRGIQDHKLRKGKRLREVYSHLFSKKLISEGGLAGHMMHPYEALDMTPRQIIDRIKEYSTSQKIIEKVDGQNLFFTVEQDGTLMFARNKEDMTHDDLVAKFTGHGAEKPFVEGGNAIKRGVEQWLSAAGPAAEMEIREIFHPDGETKSFINFEIMHPDKPNQIIYDEKYIVFHSIVDYIDGRKTVYSTNKGQRLEKIIRLMDSGITSAGFTLASNRTVNLNELTSVQIENYVERVKEVALSLGIPENITLGEGIENIIKQEIEESGIDLDRETLKKIYDFVLYGEDRQGNKIKSRDFTSSLVKSDVAGLRSLDLTSTNKALKKVQSIISPFKDVFVDLGIDLLSGVKSAYMSDETNQKNIALLRDKLQTAINDLIEYMNENPENYWEPEVHRLRQHLDKVIDKDITDIVATTVEGGVYDYQGDLIKVTGGFAPLNQILGAAYRDKKGIFPTFKQKFMQQESNRRSLKSVFNLIF